MVVEPQMLDPNEAPPLPDYDDEGVDLTQIRRSLTLTPWQRVLELEEGIRMLEALERARSLSIR